MSQKLPLGGFKWVENTSEFTKYFIKICNEDSNEGYFLEDNVQYIHDLHNDLPFLPKRIKIEKVEKVVANLHDKK